MWPFSKKTQTSPDGEVTNDSYHVTQHFPLSDTYAIRVEWYPTRHQMRFVLRDRDGRVYDTSDFRDMVGDCPTADSPELTSRGLAGDLAFITTSLPAGEYGGWRVSVGLGDTPTIDVLPHPHELCVTLPRGSWGVVYGKHGPIYLDTQGAWCTTLTLGQFRTDPADGIDWESYVSRLWGDLPTDTISDIFPILIQQFDLDPSSLLHTYTNPFDGLTYVRNTEAGTGFTHTMSRDADTGLYVFTKLVETTIPEGMAIAMLAVDVGNLAKQLDTDTYACLSHRVKVKLRDKLTGVLVDLVVASTQPQRMPDAIKQARTLLKLIPSIPMVFDDIANGG